MNLIPSTQGLEDPQGALEAALSREQFSQISDRSWMRVVLNVQRHTEYVECDRVPFIGEHIKV